jgi:hypothetical protein
MPAASCVVGFFASEGKSCAAGRNRNIQLDLLFDVAEVVEFGQICSIDLFPGHARGSQHVPRFVVRRIHREEDRAKDFDRPIGAEVCKSLNKVF